MPGIVRSGDVGRAAKVRIEGVRRAAKVLEEMAGRAGASRAGGWELGGGGVLSLEKGTDCSLTAGERWLLRPTAGKKKGGCPYIILQDRGEILYI